ncbi:hypothetical protein LBMAG56_11680 [Verrucomicrobiota bacterium]|nr:hypothetical protein LBMAG56_11680 [Verrucomicrobiota bacterium]
MKTHSIHPLVKPTVCCAAALLGLWLTGCATQPHTAIQSHTAMPPLPAVSPGGLREYRQGLGPLGTIGISTVQEDEPLRIQVPPTRGEAVKKAASAGARALAPVSYEGAKVSDFWEDNHPHRASQPEERSMMMVGGAFDLAQTLVAAAWSPVGAAWGASRAASRAIPEAVHAPALAALRTGPASVPITAETTRRIVAQTRQTTRHSIVPAANSVRRECDTILELYHGERSLRGGDELNPSLQLHLGYRVRVLRADDRRELDVFRVAYRSEGRKFADWGANDAAALRAELDRGLAVVTGQIVAQLADFQSGPARASSASAAPRPIPARSFASNR